MIEETRQTTHDEILHDCAIGAAQLYETLQLREAERTELRRQWLARLAAEPELKALDGQISTLERVTKGLKDALKDALTDWQGAAAQAFEEGWSKTKTFQDGMVTAVARSNVIIDSDTSAMLQFGHEVLKEHPEYFAVLFKPDPDGFKKLATDNPKALQALGYVTIPPEVMRMGTVISGRINNGWEAKALELLPLPETSRLEISADRLLGEIGKLKSAKELIGDGYPRDFHLMRPLILERDHWNCMAGDCPEYGDDMNVHHINADKNDNGPNNLITLCPSCHKSLQSDTFANAHFSQVAKDRSWEGDAEWRSAVFGILGSTADWRTWKANEEKETSNEAAT